MVQDKQITNNNKQTATVQDRRLAAKAFPEQLHRRHRHRLHHRHERLAPQLPPVREQPLSPGERGEVLTVRVRRVEVRPYLNNGFDTKPAQKMHGTEQKQKQHNDKRHEGEAKATKANKHSTTTMLTQMREYDTKTT